MRRRSVLQSPRLPWAIGGFLVLLLALLAALQVRWLDQVAEAEKQRLEAGIETALGALTAELDRELSRALLVFHAPPPGSDAEAVAAEQWRVWRRIAPIPELVSAVEVVEHDPHAGHHADLRRPGPRLIPELPGLLVPVPAAAVGGRPTRAVRVSFDRALLGDDLLPALVERHLEPVLGADAEVRVSTAPTGLPVWSSAPRLRHDRDPFEWRAELFAPLPPEELARLAFGIGGRGAFEPHLPEAVPRRPGFPGRWHRMGAFAALRDTPAGWTIEVRPAAGSLDAALARARRGNTAVVAGIFLLLVVSALALALAARRAQETARRQVEFTAAVSHELRTPLAAIRSLADNLADGVVADPERARRYGTEIAHQGERLTTMVEQVLALAAEDATLRPRTSGPVDVAALVRSAVRDALAAAPETEVEIELADDLPPAAGDRAVLERALGNLVGNAVKHGRAAGDPRPWVGVRATRSPGGAGRPEVSIAVSDRGPGVPAAERERLFEPFFRGSGARERQLPGSGLGLHLVRRIAEAHGGRVEVATAPGGGSRFTLHLPAADPREAG